MTGQGQDVLQKRLDTVEVKLVAIYRIERTEEELRRTLLEDPTYTSLSWDYLLELFERLYLFDVWISDVGLVPQFLDGVTQDNDMDQAPYLEMYFNGTGDVQLFRDQPYMPKPPEDFTSPCRLRFYLHYTDTDAALLIAGHELPLPEATPLPAWLSAIMPYTPPN